MKKIKIFLFLAFGVLSFVSCTDAVDIVQDGEINRVNAFKTVADLRKYINGDIYTRVGNRGEIEFSTIFTDEVGVGPDNGGQNIELHRFQLNATVGEVAVLWNSNYILINRVNRLIEFADLVKPIIPSEILAKMRYWRKQGFYVRMLTCNCLHILVPIFLHQPL